LGGSLAPVEASHAGSIARTTVGGTLVIDNESGGTWPVGFSPFNSNTRGQALGVIYEPLVYINNITGKNTPWLATAWKWSPDGKTLTFTIRQGVKWSDGQPFSAADVVYTFNLMKKYPALDLQSVWSVLKSVTQQGANQVVMTFNQPAVPWFYYVADQEGIVAQHVWSTIKNPVTYVDTKPVGTGPFLASSQTTPMDIVLVRNPNYWQTGKPYISKVEYPAFLANPPANLYLAEGKADWGGQFIPSVDSYYVAKDKVNNHYWYPPQTNVSIYINQTVYPLSVKAVRQAMAYGIDRARVGLIGEYGYEPAANQTGVILPNFNSWYDSSLAAKYNYGFNPAKAMAILEKAGFKKNSSGIFQTPAGKPLSFDIITVSGNTNWIASLNVISSEMKQAGIQLNVQGLSSTDFDARMHDGNFQLGYQGDNPGPNPYYTYQPDLFSGNSAPIGQSASSNYERWNSPATDALLKQFAATTDTATQHAIIDKLEATMLEDVPIIPVTEGVSWYQWSTKNFVGWPTPSNPYAAPAPYNVPDWEVVLTTVHPK
jgi:peptide/nickel transport system substrate-binding protein